MARRVGRGLFRRRGGGQADSGGQPEGRPFPDPEATEPFPVIEPDLEAPAPPPTEVHEPEPAPPEHEPAPPEPSETDQPPAPDAGQLAEIRAIDEILALESDLERAKQQASAEIESLRERLLAAEQRADAAAALEGGADPAELRRAIREQVETEMRADLEARRAELEAKVRSEIEAEVEDRISKIQADADERVRTEVGIARGAAEEYFRSVLAERERELENERTAKAALIEESERRLAEIERKAAEAAARVAHAEAQLAAKEADLRQETERRLERERERIRAEAAGDAGRRVTELEAELERREAEMRRQRAEFENRIAQLESKLGAVEASRAREAEEMRLAAAAWVRGEIERLGELPKPPQGSEETREQRFRSAASRIDEAAARADAAAKRAGAGEPSDPQEEDTSSWDIGRPND